MPMRLCRLLLLAILSLLPAFPATAQNPMPFVQANEWDQAAAAAAQYPDPVAGKLVTFYRLLDPGGGSAAKIAAFLQNDPDWPFQDLLRQQLESALVTEPDDGTVRQLCTQYPPGLAETLLRCAAAEQAGGDGAAAARDARQAWITGDFSAAKEVQIVGQWGDVLTQADQWQRFSHLTFADSASDPAAAGRQLQRLSPDQQAAGAAWLGLLSGRDNAWGAYAALPASFRRDPGLFLAAASWLEQQNDLDQALTLWNDDGAAAQHEATPAERSAFWTQRSILARDVLRENEAKAAYALETVSLPIDKTDALDRDFLAGFIALEFLHEPAEAAQYFQTLAGLSKAAITQGRAHYWLGRAAAAAGNQALARQQYEDSATWPTTYYGQLAALALGESSTDLAARIRALADPGWTPEQALAFASGEVARAAGFLVAWGEPRRARAFVLKLVDLAPDPAGRSLAAHLALGFGLPDQAVAAGRVAGIYGEMLPGAGWPIPYQPPDGPVDPAVTLGVIRQESSFDIGAASPSGALGLMQLMPDTAERVARSLGERVSLAALAADPVQNMTLGNAYLLRLLNQFDDCLPLALAAYNAGPDQVGTWLAENGDPRVSGIGMIDWIELISWSETRDYVQRVIESVEIYQAKLDENRPEPLAPYLHGP
ncbi:MAG TPA: lytic transglycosylase domain-containing protein [Acetobacteraceae bacterium]|nr:lytic transglycosylase domain-containing protein [Acetobacteraceae bacterium]